MQWGPRIKIIVDLGIEKKNYSVHNVIWNKKKKKLIELIGISEGICTVYLGIFIWSVHVMSKWWPQDILQGSWPCVCCKSNCFSFISCGWIF